MAHSAIFFKRKVVVAVPPIQGSDFSTVADFSILADAQDFPYIIVSPEAWDKFEKLIQEDKHGTTE